MMNELYEKLTELQWLLHKQHIRGWAASGPLADTSRGQGRILAVLKLRDGISTKDLSYLLGLRVSSLNELLAKLEKGGYVSREPSEQDKRVMLVKLSEKGKNEQEPKPFDFSDIFSCLSDDEQTTFGEYLDRLITALHAIVGEDDDEVFQKMEALRARYGNIEESFGEHGRGRHGGRGHGRHKGHDHDRPDHHYGRCGRGDHDRHGQRRGGCGNRSHDHD